MSQVWLIVFIFMCPKYTALFWIHTPEYFTSLAAGIAAGPFDGQDVRSDFSAACAGSRLSVWVVTVMREHVAAEAKVRERQSLLTHSDENHLRWVMRSKETIMGVILCCLAN